MFVSLKTWTIFARSVAPGSVSNNSSCVPLNMQNHCRYTATFISVCSVAQSKYRMMTILDRFVPLMEQMASIFYRYCNECREKYMRAGWLVKSNLNFVIEVRSKKYKWVQQFNPRKVYKYRNSRRERQDVLNYLRALSLVLNELWILLFLRVKLYVYSCTVSCFI